MSKSVAETDRNGAQSATNGHHAPTTFDGYHVNDAVLNCTPARYPIVRFARATDNQPQPEVLDWPGLAKLLTTHETRPDKDGALFSPTRYKDGATRGKAGVLAVSCLVLDFDNGIAPGALKARWKAEGLAYALHSSHSSTPDFPKWRAIFPLASPVPGEEWPRVWRKLAASIGGGHIDASCKDASRIYYLPSCPPEYSQHAFSERYDGEPLDVDTVPDLPDETTAREAPHRTLSTARAPLNGASRDHYRDRAIGEEMVALQNAGEGNRNATLNKTAFRIGQFIGAGRYSRVNAEYELLRAATSIGLSGSEAKRTIQSGLDAGKHKPEYSGLCNGTGTDYHADATFHRAGVAYPHKSTSEQTTGQAILIRPDTPTKPKTPTGFSAAELMAMELPETSWIIPGLLPEGYGFLAGAPKLGKSWLTLNLAVAVASGGRVLGSIEVEQGDVLYLALEDTARRLKSRLQKVLRHDDPPAGLRLETEWPRLTAGGLAKIDEWLTSHPTARLVIVDTLQKVRTPHGRGSDIYGGDYKEVAGLKRLADLHNVAILVVHHTTKMEYSDPLQSVSGSMGLTGAADSIFVLKRDRTRADATLFITGRDVDEQEMALDWDGATGTWKVLGEAANYRLSEERKAIIDVLEKSSEPLAPIETAARLKKNHSAVKKLMYDMSTDGQISTSSRGKYIVIGNYGNSGDSGDFGNHGNSGVLKQGEFQPKSLKAEGKPDSKVTGVTGEHRVPRSNGAADSEPHIAPASADREVFEI